MENIIENNKLIAEFMGFDKDTYGKWFLNGQFKGYSEKEFSFHTGWNWLMPVVEKIDSLNEFAFAIDSHPDYGTWVGIHKAEPKGITNLVIPEVIHKNKIEAVYNACVEFIKWYNQQKQ